ncbi:MAG: M20 family metallopeptidase [Fimbriimonas sp.]
MSLRDRIASVLPQITEIRHDFHRHPELGYQEVRTSGRVVELLSGWGVEHVAGLARGTGVLGYLPATNDPANAPTVALRADMDALPIKEDTGAAYASEHEGVMHACGHDGHTSILLGAAKVLSETERPNNVLLVFQPAEEGGAGAKALCEDGVLDGRVLGKPVDHMFGLHGFPMGQLGHVYTRNGAFMAAASEFRMTITGKGTHAAYPHFGIDPIVVAAHIITALQTIASRAVNPLDSVVVTVGKVEAGMAHNVIPETAVLKGTLRALNDATNQLGKDQIGLISHSVAAAFGATAVVEWIGAYPVTFNDPDATDHFRGVARDTLGEEFLHEEAHPTMGAEDFSFYGQRVSASFFFLGLRGAHMESFPNLHAPQFDFNDGALPVGIEMMCALARS